METITRSVLPASVSWHTTSAPGGGPTHHQSYDSGRIDPIVRLRIQLALRSSSGRSKPENGFADSRNPAAVGRGEARRWKGRRRQKAWVLVFRSSSCPFSPYEWPSSSSRSLFIIADSSWRLRIVCFIWKCSTEYENVVWSMKMFYEVWKCSTEYLWFVCSLLLFL